MSDQEKKTGTSANFSEKLWVVVVLLIGIGAGLIFYSLTFANIQFFLVPPRILAQFKLYEEFHIILSTTGMALLVALIIVYGRTYIKTRANFIFGLLVVLFALLLQAVLNSPVYLAMFEHVAFYPELSSPIADVFMIVAYTVFLYLSLE